MRITAARRRAAVMRIPLGTRDHAVVVGIHGGEIGLAPARALGRLGAAARGTARRRRLRLTRRLRAGRAAGGAVAYGAGPGLRKNHVVTGRRHLRREGHSEGSGHRYDQQFLEVHTVSWLKRKSNLFWLGQCAFHRKQRAGEPSPVGSTRPKEGALVMRLLAFFVLAVFAGSALTAKTKNASNLITRAP